MIKVVTPEEQIASKLLPTIFLEGIELEENNVVVYYSFFIEETFWLDDSLLKETNVIVKANDLVLSENMLSIKQGTKIKGNQVFRKIIIPQVFSNLVVECYSENKFIQSTKNTETILVDGVIQKINYNNKTYNYVNKTKDLRLLKVNFQKFMEEQDIKRNLTKDKEEAKKRIFSNNAYVSYTVDKKAKIAYQFSMKNFLTAYSDVYNIFSVYPAFAKTILLNSRILTDKSSFSKKNITISNKEYNKFSNVAFKKVNQDDTYLVMGLDKNEDKLDNSRYSIRTKLIIENYADQLLNVETKPKIANAVSFIKEYKNLFELFEKNNVIVDPNIYIFENEWQKEEFLNKAKSAIEILVSLGFIFTSRNEQRLVEFFTSILHPLSTRSELLQKLLNYALSLQESINYILASTTLFGTNQKTNSNNKEIEIEFEFDPIESYIDFNYQKNFGYEVISNLSKFDRERDNTTELLSLNSANQDLRKKLENLKYFSSAVQAPLIDYKTFSISYLELGEKSYDLLTAPKTIQNGTFQEAFLKLKEYGTFNFNYRKLESFFFQLSEDDVTVKTIASKNNGSINNLRKSVLFDPNLDSQQKSLEFIASTGLERLYFNYYKDLLQIEKNNSTQYSASQNLVQSYTPIFIFSGSAAENIDLYPKALFYYNSVFEERAIITGEYTQLFKLEEKNVSSVFNDKLRHFNQFYLKIIKEPQTPTDILKIPNNYLIDEDVMFNIPVRFVNRSLSNSTITVSFE
jgi:hypothetical protein